jgi:hypothetical protein
VVLDAGQVGDQAEHLPYVLALDIGVVVDDPPARTGEVRLSGMSLFSRIST